MLAICAVMKRKKNESKSETIVIEVSNGKDSKKFNKLKSHGGKRHLDVNSASFDVVTSKSNDISKSSKTSKENELKIRDPTSPMYNDTNLGMVEMGGIVGDITPMYCTNDPHRFPARARENEAADTDEGDYDDEEKTEMISKQKQFGKKLSDNTLVQTMVMNDILNGMEGDTDNAMMGEMTNNGYMHIKSNPDNKVKSSQEMVMVQGMVLDDIIDEIEFSTITGESNETNDEDEDNESEYDVLSDRAP